MPIGRVRHPWGALALEATTRIDQHTIGSVTINGVRMRAVFDTGASTSYLSLAAAARAGVHPNDPGVRLLGYGGNLFGRGVTKAWVAPIASVDLGGERILKTQLVIGSVGADVDLDMLIGADFFLSHRVFVANSTHRMFFTYQGGPVFSLGTAAEGASHRVTSAAPNAPSGPEPADADGYARRAAIAMVRRDFGSALADLDKAVADAPGDARNLEARAGAHAALNQPALAMDDLDRAITLKPDLIEARMRRAALRAHEHDRAGARADLDAAAGAAAPQADLRLEMGTFYGELEAFESAMVQYDLWIAAHPDDSRRPNALNGRCRARALWGRDLDRALSDCDAALRARPRTPDFLDSRGLVELRLGRNDKALGDYDAALAENAKLPWSLYGRGLARRRLGQAKDGDADIAAAIALQPDIAERARRYGIAPPG